MHSACLLTETERISHREFSEPVLDCNLPGEQLRTQETREKLK
jgi:hypothetical protein